MKQFLFVFSGFILFMLFRCGNSYSNEIHSSCNVNDTLFLPSKKGVITKNKELLFFNQELFSGFLFEKLPDGSKSLEHYCEGYLDGESLCWWQNGKLAQKRYYMYGKKEAVHYGWWEDGRPQFEYHFNNDIYEGSLKEWFNNGQIAKEFNYKAGQEDGTQKMWRKNGKLHANYFIKDGRRYGYQGSKSCISVKDSLTANH